MPGHALALALAVLLDAWLGEPAWLYRRIDHPVVLIGRLAGLLERRLLDPSASARRQRLAGLLLLVLTWG